MATQAKPAAQEDDFVMEVFKKQQATFRTVFDGLKGIKFPFGASDDATIKQFAGDLEKIKKAAGVPPMAERYDLLVDQQKTSNSVKDFLASCKSTRASIGMKDDFDFDSKLAAAVAKVEGSIGGPLLFSDAKGMAALAKEVAAVEKEMGLGDVAKLEAEAKLEEAKLTIDRITADVVDTMDMVKGRDGLKDVTIDPASLAVK